MKRKDDLLRLAFGELNDDAARAVESRADDAERAELESFRRLHDGLRHLPSPPPDGLSSERLRAAILDRDLKVRRPFAWGPALFAPAALAALAVVVMLPRLRPRPEPQIFALNERPTTERRVADLMPADAFQPQGGFAMQERGRAASSAVEARDTVSQPLSVKSEPTARRRRVRHRRAVEVAEEPQMKTDGMQVYNPPIVDENPTSTMAVAIHEPQTIAAPPSAVVEAAPGGTGKTETVVIVSSKRDLETGAPAATEREASSVLVGG